MLRFSAVALLVYVGLLVLTYRGFKAVPTGFIPQQDLGYLIVNLQLPDAAAFDRTDAVLQAAGGDRQQAAGRARTRSPSPATRVLTGTNQSNAGTMFVVLKPFDERNGHPEQSADAVIGQAPGGLQPGAGGLRPGAPAAAGARDRHGRRVQDAGART